MNNLDNHVLHYQPYLWLQSTPIDPLRKTLGRIKGKTLKKSSFCLIFDIQLESFERNCVEEEEARKNEI
jgi:hypothetical protein